MNVLENLFVVVMAFYPLRHIGWGIDLRDTGYNYANFQYMGTEHMDPMWLFSTYLAHGVGNLLMKLPGAEGLAGMNLYTGLTVSLLALAGYFFCTRKLGMPRVIVFAGEMMAESLCWCPTALLYNYLTYLLFAGAFILLYCGLVMEEPSGAGRVLEGERYRRQRRCLAGAGVLLGTNVLVRFPNLPEAAMIAAVWAYDVILWMEGRKKCAGAGGKPGARSDGKSVGGAVGKPDVRSGGGAGMRDGGSPGGEGFWHRLGRHTLWCVIGYAAALAVWFGWIHIRYGMGEYIGAVRRLFAMTEGASDYKASSMVMGLVGDYVENLYWAARIGVIAAGGLALFWAAGWLEEAVRRRSDGAASRGQRKQERQSDAAVSCRQGERLRQNGPALSRGRGASGEGLAAAVRFGVRILWAAVCAAMVWWLYRRFCSTLFFSYDSIRRPCILFLMLAMLAAVIRIFHRDSPREEKLLSGMLILLILLTSIGSNNRTMPSWNNLFVAAPYTLWESWKFVRGRVGVPGEAGRPASKGIFGRISLFPVKAVLVTFLGVCLFQSAGFGAEFVFAEGTGVQNATAYVENNEVLKNVRMDAQKAQWMTELSAFAEENGLKGKEVILYGQIPALSYYLQMPSAFNPWSDLRSYAPDVMEEEMAQLEREIAGGAEPPVVILENGYALYVEGNADALAAEEMEQDGKWKLLVEFMEKYDYGQVLRNGKFAVYR